ncbi:MAG TPA: hypothetical protein VFC90_13750 [Planctomycetota bacterium]|nr:hypothetical protein [Planctomycetota bacterium]
MTLTKAQSLLLSNDQLLAHIIENAPKPVQSLEVLPFFPVDGDSLRINRAATSGDFGIAPLWDKATGAFATTEGKTIPTSVSFELKQLVQDVIVMDFAANTESNVNSQVGVQLETAIRRFLYEFCAKLYAGVSAGPDFEQFNGIVALLPAAQKILPKDVGGFLLVLDDLARLVGQIKANSGRPHVLVTHTLGYKNILKAHYDKGLRPHYALMNVPDCNGGMKQRLTPTYDGIPILIDDNISTTDTIGGQGNGIGIYALVLGRGGLYGITPAVWGSKIVRVKEVLGAATANTTYRIFMNVSLVLESEVAAAQMLIRTNSSVTP